VTPCYNEEENVRELHERVRTVMAALPGWDYEHIFIDNASKDRTVPILRELAKEDKRVKVIVNFRNFGSVRSPCHAILQARGDAVICLVADLRDPTAVTRDRP
jgi:glycosyltransferase involved in cell wall biosynthesis